MHSLHNARQMQQGSIIETVALSKALQQSQPALKGLKAPAHSRIARVVTLVAIAAILTVYILYARGISWKKAISHLRWQLQQPMGWRSMVGLAAAALWLGGTLFLIFVVTHDKGKFWGEKHYRASLIHQNQTKKHKSWHYPTHQLVDLSLLKGEGDKLEGKTYGVQMKGGEHDPIALSVLPIAPLITVGTVAYNVIRFCLIPFYIGYRMIQEKAQGEQIYPKERLFRLSDIPREMALSLKRAVEAPFYGLAYLFSALFALIDPMGGRKLGMLVTQRWMEVERSASYWTCHKMSQFRFEGGGGPLSLGKHGFYWTGCWLPWVELEFQEGKITKAAYPGERFHYDLLTPEMYGCKLPSLHKLPLLESTEPVEKLAGELEPGFYRCVVQDHKLYLIAHVTTTTGKRQILHAKCPDNREVEDVDGFLNGLIQQDDGEKAVTPYFGRYPNLSVEGKIQKHQQPPEGYYRLVRAKGELYFVDHERMVNLPAPTTRLQWKKERCHLGHQKPEDAALELPLGEAQEVVSGGNLFLIGHRQNVWGDHIHSTRLLGKKDRLLGKKDKHPTDHERETLFLSRTTQNVYIDRALIDLPTIKAS